MPFPKKVYEELEVVFVEKHTEQFSEIFTYLQHQGEWRICGEKIKKCFLTEL